MMRHSLNELKTQRVRCMPIECRVVSFTHRLRLYRTSFRCIRLTTRKAKGSVLVNFTASKSQ